MILLSSMVSAQNCLTNADKPTPNCDGTVSMGELINHINSWYSCSSCVNDLFKAIQAFYGIPFCGDNSCSGIEDCGTCSQDCTCAGSWSFATVSDSYGGFEYGVSSCMLTAATYEPDLEFMVSTGDFSNSDTIDGYLQSRVRDAFYTGQQYFPWFNGMGNHNCQDAVDLDWNQNVLGARYSSQLPGLSNFKTGPPYNDTGCGRKNTTYSFDYRNAHFIMLNQYDDAMDSGGGFGCMREYLLNWLQQDLESTNQPLIFVFGHEPAFPGVGGNQHCGDSLDDGRCPGNVNTGAPLTRAMRDRFWDLLSQHNVVANFAGHLHYYSVRQVKDVSDFAALPCTATPGGGGCSDTSYYCGAGALTNFCCYSGAMPNIASDAVLTPTGGVIDFTNAITSSGGQWSVIRVNGNIITFSTYSRSGSAIVPGTLLNRFSYDATSLIGCSNPSECSDRMCKVKSCVTGQCVYSDEPDGTSCDDGDAMTVNDACMSGLCQGSQASAIYVDGGLLNDCVNYDVNSKSCGTGGETAYNTLDEGSAAAQPGDVVLVRGGTDYTNWFRVQGSGTAGNPITIRSYTGESPTISLGGSGVGILIENQRYVDIEGLTVSNVWAWGQVIDSDHITFRNNLFQDATDSGSRGSLRFVNSDHNKVIGNRFDTGNDNLFFENSNYNVAEDNYLYSGRHSLLVLSCSNNNVIRNNTLENPIQKAGETFDCEGVVETLYDDTRQVRRLDATKRNIWEGNSFILTAPDRPGGGGYPDGPFAGIQYAGQEGIIRNNVFYDNNGGGIGFASYPDEAMNNYGNRVYNNVFYENHFAGIGIPRGTSYTFQDNIIKNNILYRNDFVNWNGVYDYWGWGNGDGRPMQVWDVTTGPTGYVFERNNILGTQPGQDDVITHADYYETSEPTIPYSLSWWEQNHPSQYTNNREVVPGFVNGAGHDFHLAQGSPMIDAGLFLSTATGAGSGTSLPVADASYFYDGYGIDGEVGDLIQVEGRSATARITSIDYNSDTLTLGSSLSWSAGEGVSLAYSGSAPDMGAFEDQGSAPVQTCAAQGGDICTLSETCSGSFISASDSSRCCNVGCTSSPSQEFTFAAYGDSRTGTTIHNDIVNQILGDNVDFVIHTGDFVATGSIWSEWQSMFLNIAGPLLYHAPSPGLTSFFYPSLGNHETRGTGWDTNYFNVFNVSPINQYYYSFDYNNAHFVSLYVTDTWAPADFNPSSAQYQWLASDLAAASADPNIKWKFVFFHAPVFSCIASHACGENIQEHLVPLFDQHNITAVFGGDDHSYQRIGPIKDYALDPLGVTYLITAGGGATLYSFYGTTDCNLHEGRTSMPCDPSWTGMPHQSFPLTAGESVNHYMRFTVRDDVVIGEAVRLDDTVIETFNMRNGGSGASTCTIDPDCPDIECRSKSCVGGQCVYSDSADGTSCTGNGQFCDGAEICQSGSCQSPGNPCVDDGYSCTLLCDEGIDSCNAPDDTLCDDSFSCTANDRCIGAGGDSIGCAYDSAYPGVSCNDGYSCTENDACDGSGNCRGTANHALCLTGTCTSATCDPVSYPAGGCGNFNPPQCNAPSGLSLWMKFDDTPADGASDSSGIGNFGTCSTCPVFGANRNAIADSAYVFDGYDDHFTIASPTQLNPSSEVTISVWLRSSLIPDTHGHIAGHGDNYGLRVNDDNGIGFWKRTSGWVSINDLQDVLDGSWHHVIGMQDSTGMYIYIDGVMVESNTNVETIVYDQGTAFEIGRYGNQNDAGARADFDYQGYMDDLRVYPRGLSVAEIQQLAGS